MKKLTKIQTQAFNVMFAIKVNHGDKIKQMKKEEKAEFIINDYINDLIRTYIKYERNNKDEIFAILNKSLRKYLNMKSCFLLADELKAIFE